MAEFVNRYWCTAAMAASAFRSLDTPYCIIKSYSGSLEYEDGNVDIVVPQPLWTVYDAAFADLYLVSRRDALKHRLYERNKLMLTPRDLNFVKLHLHSECGWHDLCFVSSSAIIGQSQQVEVDGCFLEVASRSLEARIAILHMCFERFRKTVWDESLVRHEDYMDFARRYGIGRRDMEVIVSATVGRLPLMALAPIWWRFYAAEHGWTPARNYLLHSGWVILSSLRRAIRRGGISRG